MAEIKKPRIYKFDNVKAVLIFLVVVGHMTTDYVSTSHAVRWVTLFIYTFHMPAFILVSGLMHKQYITLEQAANGKRGNTKMRWEKFLMFLFCAYALKAFLYFFRMAIGQNPTWSWYIEPGIPWYLIVMAEYEVLLYLTRKIPAKAMLICSFVISALIGYLPMVGDAFSLSRMINFLPIYLIGYYMTPQQMLDFCDKKKVKIAAPIILIALAAICYFGPWGIYGARMWFTGRRTYEFLDAYLHGVYPWAWALRLLVWALAITFAFAIITIMPNRDMKLVSKVGAKTLNVYFWHRPVCYWICGMGVFPTFAKFFHSAPVALIAYIFLALALTIIFALPIFDHPCKDLTKLANKICKK